MKLDKASYFDIMSKIIKIFLSNPSKFSLTMVGHVKGKGRGVKQKLIG